MARWPFRTGEPPGNDDGGSHGGNTGENGGVRGEALFRGGSMGVEPLRNSAFLFRTGAFRTAASARSRSPLGQGSAHPPLQQP
jgi:hypothetical protein